MRVLLMLALMAVASVNATASADPVRSPAVGSSVRPLPWPPPGAVERAPESLHFRGPRPFRRVNFWGPYGVDSASGPSLGYTREEHRFMVVLPGEWESAGLCTDSTYNGRFVYRDDASNSRLRGASGSHTGVVDATGTVHVRVTFDDRRLAPFDMKWVPSRRLDSIPVTELTPEDIRAMQARQMVHPVWPPPETNTFGK